MLCASVAHRSACHRRLIPGDGGVLFEYEPTVVPVRFQGFHDLGDPWVALAERHEQPA